MSTTSVKHAPQGGLVVVGSVALDTLEIAGQRHDDVLGGSASFFSAAASYFAPVKLVAVVGEDFPTIHTDFFKRRGVALEGLTSAPGKTFRWTGRYSDDLSHRTTLDTQLNVFADFSPSLPEPWRDVELLFLGNIHPGLQLSVLDQVRRPRLVAMDTMNFWIEGQLEPLKQVLARVDLLVINDEEARQLAQKHNLVHAAAQIRALGPKTVIIKRGDSGALLFYGGAGQHGSEQGIFAAPAFPLERVVDPTGAGDTFAGGFMGALARARDIGPQAVRRAMFYGSVMASFCVEGLGLDKLRDLQPADIDARYRAFRDLTHFEDVRL
jgi:sugar/nucleoside kinase (ribokinase family)